MVRALFQGVIDKKGKEGTKRDKIPAQEGARACSIRRKNGAGDNKLLPWMDGSNKRRESLFPYFLSLALHIHIVHVY